MKNNSITSFAIVFLAIFLCIIGYLSTSIILQIKTGEIEAERDFSNTISSLRTMASEHAFLSESYIEQLKSFLNTTPRVDALIIGQDDEVKFAYPLHSKYIQPNYKREPQVHINSPFVRIFETRVSVKEPYDTQITAPVYILQTTTLFTLLKRALIISLVAVFFMFFLSLFLEDEKKSEKAKYRGFKKRNYSDHMQTDNTEASYIDDSCTKNSNTITAEQQAPIIQNISYHSGKQSESSDDLVSSISKNAMKYDPMGLFSQSSGAGRNNYFESTLDTELFRSISNEQDLTLVLININNIDHSHYCARQITDIFTNVFNLTNHLFEYGSSGYALLLKGKNLEQSIDICENLYIQIESLLDENQIGSKIAIGLSNRAGRVKLSATRLVYEANEALSKAKENAQYPIIAFKVDSQKYNQMY
ncbi:MAG: hypothetical protein ACRC4W_02755 [Treponemataceae bacterium]